MAKRENHINYWVLFCLIVTLAACDRQPENSAASPTSTLSSNLESTETIEQPPLPDVLAPVEEEPTYISVSQFPVAVIESASAQRPAYISVEMAGFDIAALTWQIGRYEEDCDRLIGLGKLLPAGSETWPDGVHQANFSWPAAGYFLSDGERADFVYLQIVESERIVSGRYRSAVTGETIDANLRVNSADQIVGLQSTVGEQISAVGGDSFQLYDICLAPNDAIRVEPGVELFLPDQGQLALDQRPVTTGDYFLHLIAGSQSNEAASRTDFSVNNDFLIPDYQVYLNTEYGFQFLYPSSWGAPQLKDGRIAIGDNGSTTQTVTIHPDLDGRAPADLKNMALSQFGSVTVLFEDQVSIDNTGALWTAYGYDGANGPHTGILLAFIHDGVGYTVDMDGLETAEDQTINLMNTFVDNWLFRPDITGPRAREWAPAIFDELAMPVQVNYYQEELSNGWRRFTVGDGMSFLAVRTESLSRNDPDDIVEHWHEVAARGVTDFAVSEVYDFSLNGREWARTDFAYLGEGALPIQGFVMVAEVDDKAVIFWAEMPITRYEEQSAQFLLSLAGLR